MLLICSLRLSQSPASILSARRHRLASLVELSGFTLSVCRERLLEAPGSGVGLAQRTCRKPGSSAWRTGHLLTAAIKSAAVLDCRAHPRGSYLQGGTEWGDTGWNEGHGGSGGEKECSPRWVFSLRAWAVVADGAARIVAIPWCLRVPHLEGREHAGRPGFKRLLSCSWERTVTKGPAGCGLCFPVTGL